MATTNAGLMFKIFISLIALYHIAWRYYLVFVAVIIGAIVTIYFAYPETVGLTFEQIRMLFDGDENAVHEGIGEGQERVPGEGARRGRKRKLSVLMWKPRERLAPALKRGFLALVPS
ncbi:hypothetical protein BDV12DRAFT_204322 [Aspergillus spectabilis]